MNDDADPKHRYDRMFEGCLHRQAQAVGVRAFQMIGTTLRRALVAEEILSLLDAQDDEGVSAETVRAMLTELRARLNTDEALN